MATEVVGQHEQHFHPAPQALGRRPRGPPRHFELLYRRQKRVGVQERPAQILRVRQLDAVCSELLRELDGLGDPMQVPSVQLWVATSN